MAKPNYQFEKRQRDLAKKAKQEEKRRQKAAGKMEDAADEDVAVSPAGENASLSSGTELPIV